MSPLIATALFGAALLLVGLAYLPSLPAVRLAITPRRDGFNERFAKRLKLAGIYDRAPSFLAGAVIGVAMIAGLTMLALAGIPGGIVGFLAVPFLSYIFLIRRERTFLRRATKELIPFFNRFEAAVRAKTPPEIAYREAVEHSNVLRMILGDSAARMAGGAEFVEALEDTLDRFPLRVWRIFVRQLETHETSGGDLSSALTTTIAELNEMISLTAEAAADTASARFQQIVILSVVIVGIFGFSLVIGRETMSRLWTTAPGLVGLISGCSIMAGGFWFSLKQMRIVERRTIGEQ